MPSNINPSEIKWDPINPKDIQWDQPSVVSPQTTLEVPEWGQKSPTLYGMAGATYETLSPLAEALGLVVGGVKGFAVGGPIGAVAGAGVGYSLAERFKQRAGEALGVKQPQTPEEELIQAAKDVRTGATLQMAGEAAGVAIGATVKRLLAPFAKDVSPEAVEIAKIAKQHGVELTPAEITQSSLLSKIENMLAYLPGSTGVIQKMRLGQLRKLVELREKILSGLNEGKPIPESIEKVGLQIKNQIDDLVKTKEMVQEADALILKNEVLKKLGSSESYETIGLKARELVVEKSKEFFAKMGESYSALNALAPSQTHAGVNVRNKSLEILKKELTDYPSLRDPDVMAVLSDFAGVDMKTLKSLEGMPENQRSQILDKIIKELPAKEFSWQTFQSAWSKLGYKVRAADLAYKTKETLTKGLAGEEAGVFKQLKGALKSDMDEFASKIGGDFKKDYEILNAVYREGKTLYASPEILSILKSNPERIVDIVVRPDRITEIKQLKKVIGENRFNEIIQPAFISRVIDNASKTGEFSWNKVSDAFTKYGEQTLSEALTPRAKAELFNMIEKGIAGESIPVATKFVRDVLTKSTPDSIMNMIFHPNNAQNINITKNIINKELWNEAKTKFTEKILMTNELGLYRPTPSVRQFTKFDDPTLRTIYNPEELSTLKKFVEISKSSQAAERISGNPSGTGSAVITFWAGKAVVKDPVSGSMFWILPKGLANLYLSSAGRRYLTTGFKTGETMPQAASLATKIIGLTGGNLLSMEE